MPASHHGDAGGTVFKRSGLLRIVTLLVLATPWPGVISIAQAEASAHVIATQPGADAELGRQETFWVRIGYTSDEPISLWARPYRNGEAVGHAMSNTSLTYQGSGEALGWFALTQPGAVDEVRVTAGGGKPYREWVVSHYPVQLRWTAAAASQAPQAQWVTDMLAAEKARYAEYARKRASEPVSSTELGLFNGFMIAILALLVAGVAVPFWSVWKWRGGWRIAAAVPAALIAFVVLRIAIDTAHDPSSHNLWPFEILELGSAALAIIGVLKLARRFLKVTA